MPTKEQVDLHLLIPKTLHTQLKQLAQQGYRPFTQEVRLALESHVARAQQERKGR